MDDTKPGAAATADVRSLAAFLQTAAPLAVEVVEVTTKNAAPANAMDFVVPQISLDIPSVFIYCDSTECERDSWFDPADAAIRLENTTQSLIRFLPYMCRHCQKSYKLYAVRIQHGGATAIASSKQLRATKIGEDPPAIGPTPRTLKKLLDDQWDLYLKGRRAELAGLGIGAFVYYRRVIERVWTRVLNGLIKVAALEENRETHDTLIAAQQEKHFTRSLEKAKAHIPRSLYIDGHNPFQALYDACGDGVHEYSDTECIERAHMLRLVLTKFAERAAAVVSEDKEFRTALAKIATRQPASATAVNPESGSSQAAGEPSEQ